jgi:hypothetical protein
LRISASNIAAITGYHPWKNLPELFLYDFVYQGTEGKLLMRKDASLLGLTIVDPDKVLEDLAKKAGTAAEAAFKDALCVKTGNKIVHDIQSAASVKNKVIKEAKKKLSKAELRILEQGVRTAVDTGYGTAHENDALDLFEKQTGWPVEERNAEIRSWPFRLLDDDRDGPTVVPMRQASAVATSPRPEEPESEDEKPCVVDLTCNDSSSDASEEMINVDLCDKEESQRQDEQDAPFFSIVGSIDGIREELAPAEKDCDDDSWILRRVIVECKHRMQRLQPIPHLYDQIQAICYCFMYEVENADIVQVLRIQDRKNEGKPKSENINLTKQHLDSKSVSKDDNEKRAVYSKEDKSSKEDNPKIMVQANRVSLDDPIMQHRQQWNQVILPRLRSFAEAVYRVRRDDDKRYRLLASLCDPSDDDQEKAWKLLFTELPWLETCDTAFRNIVQ